MSEENKALAQRWTEEIWNKGNMAAIPQIVAEGDKVVQRWTFKGTQNGEFAGYRAKGKAVSFTGATILRMAGGKVAEHWGYWAQLSRLRQIGKAP